MFGYLDLTFLTNALVRQIQPLEVAVMMGITIMTKFFEKLLLDSILVDTCLQTGKAFCISGMATELYETWWTQTAVWLINQTAIRFVLASEVFDLAIPHHSLKRISFILDQVHIFDILRPC